MDTAVLGRPDVPILDVERLERRLQVRADQRGAFLDRARLRFPRAAPADAGLVLALGVPCDFCLHLVFTDGEDGHRLIGFVPGSASGESRHWAQGLGASCG
ncbi:hypothetical protein [Actinoplanes sp. NBRC 101535]|uniref:hypothetical protein n=1 Tax=Actinoplanes sp. NBRC 101535 TaxID=3032196 RepID=UPI0024A45078|nr:hypothetical protein [Actinoplanes sp. NBRC 101535]GLY08205.1 hypothetical protein Acsp01_85840 [Actinoplanes sp. NBRC 101535]